MGIRIKHGKYSALGALLITIFSVQIGASFAKMLFQWIGPCGATALRVGIAALILMVLYRPKIWKFNRKQLLSSVFYGVSVACMNLIFYLGIKRVPLGIAVAVEFIGPLGLAVILSRRMLDYLWVLLAGFGIVLLLPVTGGNVDPVGLVFLVFAGIFWALYIVAGKYSSKHLSCTEAVAAGMFFGALIVVPAGIIAGDMGHLSGQILLFGLTVAVLSSALPFSLEMYALKHLPVKVFSVLLSLDPVVASVSGFIFLHEVLTLKQWIAILCVVAASAGSTIFAPAESTGKN